MKKKELQKIAQKIAQAEYNIQHDIDIKESQEIILNLTGKVDWQYLDQLDEMVQDILKKI